MNISTSDKLVFSGALFLVYGGGMIHMAIPPVVVGLALAWLGVAKHFSDAAELTAPEEDQ